MLSIFLRFCLLLAVAAVPVAAITGFVKLVHSIADTPTPAQMMAAQPAAQTPPCITYNCPAPATTTAGAAR